VFGPQCVIVVAKCSLCYCCLVFMVCYYYLMFIMLLLCLVFIISLILLHGHLVAIINNSNIIFPFLMFLTVFSA
jgi:hypothetical protein